jgi:hypothetical protein
MNAKLDEQTLLQRKMGIGEKRDGGKKEKRGSEGDWEEDHWHPELIVGEVTQKKRKSTTTKNKISYFA